MNKQIKNDITLTLAVCLQFHGADTIIPMQRTRRAIVEQYRVIAKANSQLIKGHDTGAGKGGTWANLCWVCVAGLSEPLPHHSSLFCGQLYRPRPSHFWTNM